ncbi:hypothetical protein LCGC14_2347840, partial [marine sediment metagenome]
NAARDVAGAISGFQGSPQQAAQVAGQAVAGTRVGDVIRQGGEEFETRVARPFGAAALQIAESPAGGGLFFSEAELKQQGTEAELAGRADFLRELGADDDEILEDAMQRARGAGSPFDLVAVTETLPDGTTQDGFAVFDGTRGTAVDANTGMPFSGRIAKKFSTPSVGVALEGAAQLLGYNRFTDVPVEQRAEVQAGANAQASLRAGDVTTAREQAKAAGPVWKASQTEKLRKEFDKERASSRDMQRQFTMMETGLTRFQEGDAVGGSQLILVTFQKIIDPPSVVRQSEYARTAEGLGLIKQFQGYVERLRSGGAGVPLAELAAMVETGRQMMQELSVSSDGIRDRVARTADAYGLDLKLILAEEPLDKTTSQPTGPPPGAPPTGGIQVPVSELQPPG